MLSGFTLRRLGVFNGNVLEYPRRLHDVDDHHHADQKKYDIPVHAEVDGMEGLILGEDPENDHQGGAEDRHNGFMDFFRDDQGIGPNEQTCGDPEGPSHHELIRGGCRIRSHFSPTGLSSSIAAVITLKTSLS
jgi:hypothetical protein